MKHGIVRSIVEEALTLRLKDRHLFLLGIARQISPPHKAG
ncbi:MAG: hypothetical protein AVDCRST_MAG01-01-2725 [uncultured Rubrobacteraceae bacterium]|uniref:Uncharacterized protein n=1 Tax=uncultured Rubrobacteraceae bacterium TaxID=349277 RepID=A0A6J4PZF1_9ACTN|nr:MAG: hypothetical protein AVDCRST_MAG01-01-2725 [uncultured Rubrobacteraceae bacterium]